MDNLNLLTPERIHRDILPLVKGGISYIDALVEYSTKNDLEIESVAKIIKKSNILKIKIEDEAIENNLIKKQYVRRIRDKEIF